VFVKFLNLDKDVQAGYIVKLLTPQQQRRGLVIWDVVQQHLVPVHVVSRVANGLLDDLVQVRRLLPLALPQRRLRIA